MKKLFLIMLLCLGFGIGASAQDAKASQYAEKMTLALSDLSKSKIDMDTYVKTCETIGEELGEYLTTLESEDVMPFIEHFYNCIFYHFAKYDFKIEDAFMVTQSFKQSINKALSGEKESDTPESVATTADKFAKQLADVMEKAMNGEEDQAEAEKIGSEMGAYIGSITKDDVRIFREEFYNGLTVHISRIPALADLTSEDIKEVVEMIKVQYEKVFEAFL